jgi:DNA-binding response OmpR family regulator
VEATKTILESKPYEVIIALEGDAGLRKAREESPDLVLLDIIMPVKDGLVAAKQFKEDSRLSQIPIIMLTSYAEKKGGSGIPVSAGLELEADDYIEKPISPEALLNAVEKYLKRKDA